MIPPKTDPTKRHKTQSRSKDPTTEIEQSISKKHIQLKARSEKQDPQITSKDHDPKLKIQGAIQTQNKI